MQVDFYLLGATSVDRVLPELAERTLAAGKRMLVVAENEAQRVELDALLWSYAPASFLPHGLAGADDEADQPVLISETLDPANGATFVALADGCWREEALGFERVFHLFGPDRLEEAREAWRGLGERDGIERRYWARDDAGKWTRKA